MDGYLVGLAVGVALIAAIAGVGKLYGERAENRLERAVWVVLAGTFVGLILLGSMWSAIASL